VHPGERVFQRLEARLTDAASECGFVEAEHGVAVVERRQARWREPHETGAGVGRVDEGLSHRLLADLDPPGDFSGPDALGCQVRQQSHQCRRQHAGAGLAVHLGLGDVVEQAGAFEEHRPEAGRWA
jgi:hypothetical protein